MKRKKSLILFIAIISILNITVRVYNIKKPDNTFKFVRNSQSTSLTITSPNENSSWEVGNTYNITWESTGYIPKVNVSLFIRNQLELVFEREYDNIGGCFAFLGVFIQSNACSIFIVHSYDASIYDYSENFTVRYSITPPDNEPEPVEIDSRLIIIVILIGLVILVIVGNIIKKLNS